MLKKIACAASFTLLVASAASADNFRCPNGSIVSTGDSISVVAAKCDQPTYVVRREEPVQNEIGKTVYIEVQEWSYNEGADRLMHFLIFRNGMLSEVRSGGYGK